MEKTLFPCLHTSETHSELGPPAFPHPLGAEVKLMRPQPVARPALILEDADRRFGQDSDRSDVASSRSEFCEDVAYARGQGRGQQGNGCPLFTGGFNT